MPGKASYQTEEAHEASEHSSAKKSKYRPKVITRLQRYLAAIAGDAEAPEPITNEEKLLYNIADRTSNDQFIVRLTPTSETGGTMDKSNAEILAAYMQGKRIMFDITVDAAACRVQATLSAAFEGAQYPSFNAYGIDTSGTTIINLYVDPSDEESYTFSMDAVEIGGEESPIVYFTITYTYNGGSPKWTSDKSYNELRALLDSGKVVRAKFYGQASQACLNVYASNLGDGHVLIDSLRPSIRGVSDWDLYFVVLDMDSTNEITPTTVQIATST